VRASTMRTSTKRSLSELMHQAQRKNCFVGTRKVGGDGERFPAAEWVERDRV
jgi:hypothetical protein